MASVERQQVEDPVRMLLKERLLSLKSSLLSNYPARPALKTYARAHHR
jgi:hypothetical protein